jgi:hypothetical protein
MKTSTDDPSFLLQWAYKLLKYFLLAMLGFGIAYVMSVSFGALSFSSVLMPIFFAGFWRTGLILLSLMTIAIFVESLR